jgi:ethanolamine ammonia-lyase small subunit
MSAPDPSGLARTESPGQLLDLRTLTPARVALTRTGVSVTTRHALEFALAHAQARDAVHSILDVPALTSALDTRSLLHLKVQSAAPDRTTYLRRPDLGRALGPNPAEDLTTQPLAKLSFRPERSGVEKPATSAATTLTIILADALSATATNRHAIPLLDALLPMFDATWNVAPIILAQQARVALGDPIGQALNAHLTLMLIGERPGLSSPDSLGAYITWKPQPGRTDAERNCVSNIRPPLEGQAGLEYLTAAKKIAWYLTEGRRLGLTGVALRESDTALLR